MRVIIAGSRTINISVDDLSKIIIESKFNPTVVISGGAKGADTLGELWAFVNYIECEKYPADWDTYGKSAGYIRNELMASKADALIALWDGKSRGTKHMIDIAKKRKLPIHIWVAE